MNGEASEPLLTVQGLNLYYGQSRMLKDIDLSVPRGTCLALMGRNGVGKTTLLRAILGLLPSRSGNIRFAGEEISKVAAYRRARLGIGYVPQGREIFTNMSIGEHLRLALSARGDARAPVPEFVYELFPILKVQSKRRAGALSGGMQQQLALARALVTNPSLLILDEPTEGIQPNIVQEIGRAIVRLNREMGLTVLLVEQKLGFARQVAKDFCIMERGRMKAAGPISELSTSLIEGHLAV